MMEDESPCGAVVAMAEEAPFVSMPPEGSNIFDLVTVLNANWGATAARHSLHRAIAHQIWAECHRYGMKVEQERLLFSLNPLCNLCAESQHEIMRILDACR